MGLELPKLISRKFCVKIHTQMWNQFLVISESQKMPKLNSCKIWVPVKFLWLIFSLWSFLPILHIFERSKNHQNLVLNAWLVTTKNFLISHWKLNQFWFSEMLVIASFKKAFNEWLIYQNDLFINLLMVPINL